MLKRRFTISLCVVQNSEFTRKNKKWTPKICSVSLPFITNTTEPYDIRHVQCVSLKIKIQPIIYYDLFVKATECNFEVEYKWTWVTSCGAFKCEYDLNNLHCWRRAYEIERVEDCPNVMDFASCRSILLPSFLYLKFVFYFLRKTISNNCTLESSPFPLSESSVLI